MNAIFESSHCNETTGKRHQGIKALRRQDFLEMQQSAILGNFLKRNFFILSLYTLGI